MDVAKDEISKLSSEEIFKKYKTFFDNVFKSNYSNKISYSEFMKIILEEIDNSKLEYYGSVKYELLIKKRILQRTNFEDKNVKTDLVSSYISDIGNLPYYDKESEYIYIEQAQNGDEEARNKIVEGNLKLVISVAKRYVNRGLSFEDLIQEGNFGLLKAIEKYKFDMETKFSTYAVWWIRQCITRNIANKSNVVRLPVYLFERINKYKRSYYKLRKDLGREPTKEEIANEMNISIDMAENLVYYLIQTVSLNEELGEESDAELQDLIPDDNTPVEETAVNNVLKNEVDDLLYSGILTARDLDVIKLRYGFDGNPPMTLEEVGKLYGVTRERIRQIENRALNKLRSTKKVFDYLDYMDSPKESFKNVKKVYDYMSSKSEKDHFRHEELVFHNDGSIQKNKVKSLYEYFPKENRNRISTAITKLNLLDQFFLYFRCGGNPSCPYVYELTDNQKKYFDEVLIQKLSDIISNLNNTDSYSIPNDVTLESNKLTKTDYAILKICFTKYRRIKSSDFKYSYNNFFITNLTDGYINRKSFSKNDIMTILHLTEEEYNNCIQEDKETEESFKQVKRITKKL